MAQQKRTPAQGQNVQTGVDVTAIAKKVANTEAALADLVNAINQEADCTVLFAVPRDLEIRGCKSTDIKIDARRATGETLEAAVAFGFGQKHQDQNAAANAPFKAIKAKEAREEGLREWFDGICMDGWDVKVDEFLRNAIRDELGDSSLNFTQAKAAWRGMVQETKDKVRKAAAVSKRIREMSPAERAKLLEGLL